jgi:hypothetical protein
MTDLADLVERSQADATRRAFESRVAEQTATLRREIAAGRFDSDGVAIGLELETYATDAKGRLVPMPDAAFETAAKELGVHNAELNTDPDPLTTAGIEAQAAAIRDQLAATRAAVDPAVVLDSVWTVPPAAGTIEYLSATRDIDGLSVPANMRPDPRYCAIDRDCLERFGGSIPFSVPGADHRFPSILFESLATSIQPHVQVPTAVRFPAYYNVAIRTLGPVLALATNSPFLPADLYDDVAPERLLAETHHELRIEIFEQSVNCTDPPKCRVPGDIDAAEELPDRVAADPLIAPFLSEWLTADGERADADPDGFADTVWEFGYKRGTYWRWLRAVIGGTPVPGLSDERSLRIEYRPLPTQPTVTDTVGFQCLVAGLLVGLVEADHPLTDLPWSAAEESFYAAARDGLAADLAWVTADGGRTADTGRIYEDLFAHARRGLSSQGVDASVVERYLDPIEERWRRGLTPSRWKLDRVRTAVADGATLPEAIGRMQREYTRLSRAHERFVDWV